MFDITKKIIVSTAVIMAPLFSTIASATVFDFDAAYDGNMFTLDVGSDNPIGSNLVAGDSFNYNIQASGDGFWKVDVGNNFFPFLAFTTSEIGIRTADFSLSLVLDGIEQFSLIQNSIVNRFIHLGTNEVTLATGLMFDEIILEYDLISSFDRAMIPNSATITDYSMGRYFPGGARDGISYIRSPINNVPEPGTLGLMGLGFFVFGFSLYRKKNPI